MDQRLHHVSGMVGTLHRLCFNSFNMQNTSVYAAAQDIGYRMSRFGPWLQSDWPAVRAIYLAGIATGNATFERDAPGCDVWNVTHIEECRVVASSGAHCRTDYAELGLKQVPTGKCGRGEHLRDRGGLRIR